MPMVWNHHFVLRPTKLLRDEFADFTSNWRLPQSVDTQIWRAPIVGDHDYEGQARNAITRMKLVFLAELHRCATTEDPDDRPVAYELIAHHLPLTEEFFDERWKVEDLGPFVSDTETTISQLQAENIMAVEGPERSISSLGHPDTSMRDEWSEQVASQAESRHQLTLFCQAAIMKLCRRFEETHVQFRERMRIQLDLTAGLESEGITLKRPSRLMVTLELAPSEEHRLDFKLYQDTSDSVGPSKIRMRGTVYGERDLESGDWQLTMETVEQTTL